jgi:hypothetical protein
MEGLERKVVMHDEIAPPGVFTVRLLAIIKTACRKSLGDCLGWLIVPQGCEVPTETGHIETAEQQPWHRQQFLEDGGCFPAGDENLVICVTRDGQALLASY